MIPRPRFYVKRIPLGMLEEKRASGMLLIVVDEDLRDHAIMNPEGDVITIPLRGHRMKEEELREILRKADGATLIGEHAVGIAIDEGLIDRKSIVYLEDESGRKVPYAVFIRI